MIWIRVSRVSFCEIAFLPCKSQCSIPANSIHLSNSKCEMRCAIVVVKQTPFDRVTPWIIHSPVLSPIHAWVPQLALVPLLNFFLPFYFVTQIVLHHTHASSAQALRRTTRVHGVCSYRFPLLRSKSLVCGGLPEVGWVLVLRGATCRLFSQFIVCSF